MPRLSDLDFMNECCDFVALLYIIEDSPELLQELESRGMSEYEFFQLKRYFQILLRAFLPSAKKRQGPGIQ